MFADTIEELHAMAALIGLKREWFQEESLKHYDLTASKRRLALRNGATEVTFEEMVAIQHGAVVHRSQSQQELFA